MEKLFVVTPVLHAWTAKMDFSPNEFFWDDVSVPKDIDVGYTLRIKYLRMKEIHVDYFRSSTPIVSEKVKRLCDEFGVNCQFVPVKIWVNKWQSDTLFYFLLLRDFVSIVDEDQSTYEIWQDRVTGENSYYTNFPDMPEFKKITNLVLKDKSTPNFFMAPEIGSRVCTERFKKETEKTGLKGIIFEELTPDFRYDPLPFL